MNMIEKVARALYPEYEWGLNNGMKDIMHDTAKRAIEAMREPEASQMIAYTEMKLKTGERKAFVVGEWEMMIDAALKE